MCVWVCVSYRTKWPRTDTLALLTDATRALGWDLLPPGTPRSNYTDSSNQTWIYAGYHDSPEKWKVNTTPVPMGWAAGIQYDGDTQRAYVIFPFRF